MFDNAKRTDGIDGGAFMNKAQATEY